MNRIGVVCLVAIIAIGIISCKNSKNNQKKQTLTRQEILNESPKAFNKRMAWWRNAKFGMFIHWGAYAVPAGVYKGKKIKNCTGEWIMNCAHIPVSEYEKYAREFNPVKYNPDRWVKLAKDAGMKYIIITSKHHEGFSLWDSKVSDYDAVDFAKIHKDLLAPLKKACDKYGIKLGFYYSIMDWHHPDAQAPNYPNYNTDKKTNPHFDRYVQNFMKPQLRELVNNYDPAVLWFDGDWIPEWNHKYGVDIYTMIRKMKPNIIINNRVDVGRNGMQGMDEGDKQYVGDFGTPEQQILKDTTNSDWEACMTMNDTWGYKEYDDDWKSADQLIDNLADIAAKGGNYLLNVGPTAKGLIPQASVQRLKEMGNWLDINGEAIYGTEKLRHHYKQGDYIRYTKKKGQRLYYGIMLDQPADRSVTFKYLKPDKGSEVKILGIDISLKWDYRKDKGLTIHIPPAVKKDQRFQHGFVVKIEGSEVS